MADAINGHGSEHRERNRYPVTATPPHRGAGTNLFRFLGVAVGRDSYHWLHSCHSTAVRGLGYGGEAEGYAKCLTKKFLDFLPVALYASNSIDSASNGFRSSQAGTAAAVAAGGAATVANL